MNGHTANTLVSVSAFIRAGADGNSRRFRAGAAALLFLLASGCASTGLETASVGRGILHDNVFSASGTQVVESRDEVFQLDEAARNFLDEKISVIPGFHERSRALVTEIFDQAAMNLEYQSAANTTASQTFQNRAANCLSMSIMTYAMARYAGLDAVFQEVYIPEYWERRDSYSLMMRHVNVLIGPKRREAANAGAKSLIADSRTDRLQSAGLDLITAPTMGVEVDFLAISRARQYPKRIVSESRVLAAFYSNKGVDALLAKDHDSAYAYFKAALRTDPALDMAVVNLALLYQMKGYLQWAEEAYREAVRLNADNAVAWEGLAGILKSTGRGQEAKNIMARLQRDREENPYFHYILGEEAYDAGDFDKAIASFRKAVRLRSDMDLAYFGLAKSYFQLGEYSRAMQFLQQAERHAEYPNMKQQYRNKIAALSSL